MKYEFTKHAIVRIKEREISTEKIKSTLKNFDLKTEENGIENLYKKFSKHALKVVIKKEEKTIRIITVHWIESARLKGLQTIIEGEK